MYYCQDKIVKSLADNTRNWNSYGIHYTVTCLITKKNFLKDL